MATNKPKEGLGEIGAVGAILITIVALLIIIVKPIKESASDPKPGETVFYGKTGYVLPLCPTEQDLIAYAENRRCRIIKIEESGQAWVIERFYHPHFSIIEFETGKYKGQKGWVFTRHLCRTPEEAPSMEFPSADYK